MTERDQVRAQLTRRRDRRATVQVSLVGWTRADLAALAEQLREAGTSSTTLPPYRLHSIAKRIDSVLE